MPNTTNTSAAPTVTLALRRMEMTSHHRKSEGWIEGVHLAVYDLDTEEMVGRLDEYHANATEGGVVAFRGKDYRVSTRLDAGGGSDWRTLTEVA